MAASAFLLHQLMAWPPHEDETLALFVGRDSLAGVVEHVTRDRGGAPLHFLFAYAVAHLGLGLGSLRLVSAAFAVASLPLVALLGRRLAGRSAALIATALVAGSWVFLFHGVYARMYSLFLFLSLLSFVLLLRALDRGDVEELGALGQQRSCSPSHRIPYGALVLAAQGVFVLAAHRERLRQAVIAFAAVAVVGMPFWLTDLVLAGRFDVGVGGHGAKLGGPWAIVTYLWQTAGDFSTGRWPVLVVVLVLALVGLVTVAQRSARARALRDRRPRGGVPRRPPRRLDVARVAPPDLRPAVLRDPRRRGNAPRDPAAARGRDRADRRARDPRGQLGLAPHAAAVRVGAEQAAGHARPGGATSWRRRAGPTTSCSATSRCSSGPGSATTRSPTSSSRAPMRCWRCKTLERQPKPLGRGVWILDASERNNLKPRLEMENRDPGPPGLFETRVFGPFLILRTREPVGTEDAYLAAAARVMLVGRSLGIGDADVNMQTIELADRSLRGYGPSVRLRSDTSR